MEKIIEFFKNNFNTILSILAFIISLINLIYLILTNKKNLTFNIRNYTLANVNKKHFYMFNVEFVNKSRLPISINEITILDNKNKYKIIKSPRLLAEKDTKRNKEIIRHQEVHSAKFPINITGLSSKQEFLVMYGPEKIVNEKTKIIINTNRGKIVKKVLLNNYYLEPTKFTEETSEYYD